MAVSSVGAGAGVLTADIIDKLKAADTSALITPIDSKVTLQKQKNDALSLLDSLLTSFQSSVKALDDDGLYQKRTVSGNSDSVSVTAESGVAVQSMSISNTVLAQKNIIESGPFTSGESKIATGAGKMTLSLDGSDFTVDYTADTSVDALKEAINTASGGKIKASSLQVGTADYRLILTSAETGANQNITFSDSVNGTLSDALKSQDTVTSGLFTSTDSLVAAGAVAQSDKFSLTGTLNSGDLSVTLDNTVYSVPFNTTQAQTMIDFKTAVEGSGLYTLAIDPLTNDMTLSATTAGVAYTINSDFAATDSGVTASTTHLSDNVTPSGMYDITMNNTNYSVAYDQNTTLAQLADKINTSVGSSVATVKQVGSSYQLIVTSTAGGNDPSFNVSDSGGFLDSKLTTGITNGTVAEEIQKASDASFKYNGITITRPTNTITDIIAGVSITLLKDGGSANIGITQNVQSVSDELSSFVTNYNTLTSQLTSMTTSDPTKKTVGIFNGDSTINGITREINKLLTSINSDGLSLSQFGIDLDEKGTMSFNSSAFTTQFTKDTKLSEKFFSGMTTVASNGNTTSVDGLFTSMSTLMDRYTKNSGIMDTLTSGGKSEGKRLEESKTKAQALLNARYETMTARFTQYDAMMTGLTNQFSSLKQQISMAVNGTGN